MDEKKRTNRKSLRDMDAAELEARAARIRDLNPSTYEHLQSYRNTQARLRRMEMGKR